MQEETVAFKMDISDESIKRNAMKVVWMFPGVTFVDIKEKGKLKVRGNFDKSIMGPSLQQIDKSADLITLKPEQVSVISSIYYSYLRVPKVQEMAIFEFKILNEHIKPAAMEVIWEFPGITSVEVQENRRLKVKGDEFNKVQMVTKLQNIDKSVTILSFGPDVEAKPEVNQIYNTSFNKGSSNAVSSKGPIKTPTVGAAGAHEAAENEKVQKPASKCDQEITGLNRRQAVGFGGQFVNPQPLMKQQEKVGLLRKMKNCIKPKTKVKHEDPKAHYAT